MAPGLDDPVDANFTRGAPWEIWEGKKCPKFNAIFDNFRFDREYLWNESTFWKSEKYMISYNSFPIKGKKLANLNPQTESYGSLCLSKPSGLFRETIFRPWGGAGFSIFAHVTTPKMYFKSDVGRRGPYFGLCPIFLVEVVFVRLLKLVTQWRAKEWNSVGHQKQTKIFTGQS